MSILRGAGVRHMEENHDLELALSHVEVASLPLQQQIALANSQSQKALAVAINRLCEVITGPAMQETLEGFARAQSIGPVLNAMIGQLGADSRRYGDGDGSFATETAHVLANTFDKVREHMDKKKQTQMVDAESDFKKWEETDDGA